MSAPPSEILWFGQPPAEGGADGDELAAVERRLADGPGDLWHSGLLRGTAGLLPELRYKDPVWWWYLNDGDGHERRVAWRVDAGAFAVRASVWERLGGLDPAYSSDTTRGLDLGLRLMEAGGVPLHVPGLFPSEPEPRAEIPLVDLHLFFRRRTKRAYRLWALARQIGRRKRPWSEGAAYRKAARLAAAQPVPRDAIVPPRPLAPLPDPPPQVSVVIPTMGRQAMVADLLDDLSRQTLPPHQVLVVDATKPEDRDPDAFRAAERALPDGVLEIHWQTSRGSCRARNEAIRRATGDYIVFGDDDIRVASDYLEKHVRLLATYGADGANGLDLRADHHRQGLEDLAHKHREALEAGAAERIGVAERFNNADSCVRRDWVERLVGNDVNFDGGYGEDTDFGHCLVEAGAVLLKNPYAANLHLKPPAGGYRFWESQLFVRRRKPQPWELRRKVGWVKPKPSPTILYGFLKHSTPEQMRDWLYIILVRYWWPSFAKPDESRGRRLALLPLRLVKTPWVLFKIWISYRFARDLMARGPLHE
jgi:GT2 family glycosyltransferase